MSRVTVLFYCKADGAVPLLDWLRSLSAKVQDKCTTRIERLAELGHELRRPEADFLRDGIYELRVGFRGQNYRMLYFFSGRTAVVVTHGIVKERHVPPKEIDRAIKRREAFEKNPKAHTFERD